MPKSKTKYPEVKDIKQDLESLKDNTVELAKHVKEDSMGQIEETAETVKNRARKEMRKVEKHVQAKPMQSIAVAFAGGIALSLLLRGRR